MTIDDIIFAKSDSQELKSNLIIAGYVNKPGDAAHHIVEAGRDNDSAIESRRILNRFNIDINDVENGVFLPHTLRLKEVTDNRTEHAKTYIQIVKDDNGIIIKELGYSNWFSNFIKTSQTKEDLIERLKAIKDIMIKGGKPWLL